MLTTYQTVVSALLQAPSAPIPLVPTATISTYINFARQQIAGQGMCIRNYATLTLVIGQQQYNFSAITGLGTGVAGVNNVRQMWWKLPTTDGQFLFTSRPFEFFSRRYLSDGAPLRGQPKNWAQLGEGQSGNLFVGPAPDMAYVCKMDVVGYPEALVDDASPEAIPQLWQLAVPFYAAWYGFMSLQRQADADMMFKRFTEQMAMARNAATPDLLMENWQYGSDPVTARPQQGR